MTDPRRWLALLMLVPSLPSAAQTPEAMMARGRNLTRACPIDREDAIVVCGRSDPTDRYRLPLPAERAPTPRPSSGGLVAAETFKTPGACGPSGTRRCTKREALTQGLGGGRNPVAVAGRLADALLAPD